MAATRQVIFRMLVLLALVSFASALRVRAPIRARAPVRVRGDVVVLGSGAMIGIVGGAIAGLLIVILMIYCCYLKCCKESTAETRSRQVNGIPTVSNTVSAMRTSGYKPYAHHGQPSLNKVSIETRTQPPAHANPNNSKSNNGLATESRMVTDAQFKPSAQPGQPAIKNPQDSAASQ